MSHPTLDIFQRTQTDTGTAGTASSRSYDDLRRRIVEMDLPPDATLSRAELAAEYGISQTPIREALQRLEQDGLVRIFPQSRTIVTRISIPQLLESHFLRVAVESEIVRVLSLSNADIAPKLNAIIAMQETLVGNTSEVGMFNELDEAFHQTMFQAAGQPGLFALIRAKGGHLARARRLDLPKEGKMRSIVERHQEITAAIAAGEPLRAQEALRDHLTGTVSRIDILRQEHPQHFQS